jgi:hypothetical protein
MEVINVASGWCTVWMPSVLRRFSRELRYIHWEELYIHGEQAVDQQASLSRP